MGKVKRIIGIYKITCTVNNKIYIGQSIDLLTRLYAHKSRLKKNKHENTYLQEEWNEYGEKNFIFEIVEECSAEELESKERLYIDQLQTYKEDIGYNVRLGKADTPVKVMQFDKQGKFIKEYNSYKEASRETGANISSLFKCCNNIKYKTHHNYIWIKSDEYTEEVLRNKIDNLNKRSFKRSSFI